jgi:hypothetical protein
MSAGAPDQLQDFPRLRVAPESLFREHQVAVHGYLEDATGGGHQPDLGVGYFLLQLGRQTGGSGLVVSDDAVFDDDPHALLLSIGTGQPES